MAAVAERFSLAYTTDSDFFREWSEALPSLTDSDCTVLKHLQRRFLEHRNRGSLPEETVDKLSDIFSLIPPIAAKSGKFCRF